MRKFVLVLAVAVLVAGCASRVSLRDGCLRQKRLYIDVKNPPIEDVDATLNYCGHAIAANPNDHELIKAYNEMFLRFYNVDGTLK